MILLGHNVAVCCYPEGRLQARSMMSGWGKPHEGGAALYDDMAQTMILYLVAFVSLYFPHALPVNDVTTLFLLCILQHRALMWCEKLNMLSSPTSKILRFCTDQFFLSIGSA